MSEVQTYVIYDIENDRIRNRISEACKDYGLARIQYSVFSGSLSKNKRGELYLRLSTILRDDAGKILILPICEKDRKDERKIINEPKGESSDE